MFKKVTTETPLFVMNVIFQPGPRIFMAKRREFLPVMGGLWNVPEGKVEKNETSIEAVLRETKEETGLIIEPQRMKKIFNDANYNCDVYITQLFDHEKPKQTEPQKAGKWHVLELEQYLTLIKEQRTTPTHYTNCDQIIEEIEH